eukprot:2991068-Prymnesium_polylepis.1
MIGGLHAQRDDRCLKPQRQTTVHVSNVVPYFLPAVAMSRRGSWVPRVLRRSAERGVSTSGGRGGARRVRPRCRAAVLRGAAGPGRRGVQGGQSGRLSRANQLVHDC